MVSGVLRLATYGMLEMGEVPRLERVIMLIPNATIRSAVPNTR